MYVCQNKYDGLYLTACGFSGDGPAWGQDREAATFESREEAESHASACDVRELVRVVEID